MKILTIFVVVIATSNCLKFYTDSSGNIQDCTPRCQSCSGTCQSCAGSYSQLQSDQCIICQEGDLASGNGDGTCQCKCCFLTSDCSNTDAKLCVGDVVAICNVGFLANLDSNECVSVCPDGVLEISDYNGNSFCRSGGIYVDPTSETPFGLGTKAYPYKSFEDALNDIVANEFGDIEVFIKESTTAEFYSEFELSFSSSIVISTYCDSSSDCTPTQNSNISFQPGKTLSQNWSDSLTLYYTGIQTTGLSHAISGGQVSISMTNINIEVSDKDFLKAFKVTLKLSESTITNSLFIESESELVLEDNILTLNNSQLAAQQGTGCQVVQSIIQNNEFTLVDLDSSVLNIGNQLNFIMQDNKWSGSFVDFIDSTQPLFYFHSQSCIGSNYKLKNNEYDSLSTVTTGQTAFKFQYIQLVEIEADQLKSLTNTDDAINGIFKFENVIQVNIHDIIIDNLTAELLFLVQSQQLSLQGGEISNVVSNIIKIPGSIQNLKLIGTDFKSSVNPERFDLLLFDVQEVTDFFLFKDLVFDNVLCDILKVNKATATSQMKNIEYKNVDYYLAQKMFSLEKSEDLEINGFSYNNVLNKNSLFTHFIYLEHKQLEIKNFIATNTQEIAFFFGILLEGLDIVVDKIQYIDSIISKGLFYQGNINMGKDIIYYNLHFLRVSASGFGIFDSSNGGTLFINSVFEQLISACQLFIRTSQGITLKFQNSKFINSDIFGVMFMNSQQVNVILIDTLFENLICNTFLRYQQTNYDISGTVFRNIEIKTWTDQTAEFFANLDDIKASGRLPNDLPEFFVEYAASNQQTNIPAPKFTVAEPGYGQINNCEFDTITNIASLSDSATMTIKNSIIKNIEPVNEHSSGISVSGAFFNIEKCIFEKLDGKITPLNFLGGSVVSIQDLTCTGNKNNLATIFRSDVTITRLELSNHVNVDQNRALIFAFQDNEQGIIVEDSNFSTFEIQNNYPIIDSVNNRIEVKGCTFMDAQYQILYFDSTAPIIDNITVISFVGLTPFQLINSLSYKQVIDGVQQNVQRTLEVKNSHFEGCDCSHNHCSGGVIQINNYDISLQLDGTTDAIVKDCVFKNNKAQDGGAISIQNKVTPKYDGQVNEVIIQGCTFENNEALVNGGCVIYNLFIPTLDSNTYTNNRAQYGEILAGFPAKLRLNLEEGFVPEIKSGQQINVLLSIDLMDEQDQIILSDYQSQIEINPKEGSSAQIAREQTAQAIMGTYTFSELIINSGQDEQHTFTLRSKAIDCNKLQIIDSSVTSDCNQFEMDFYFSNCAAGERLQSNEGGTNSVCEKCDPGFYSISENADQCIECSIYAQCLGGNQINVSPGYWRASIATDMIQQCLFSDACLGGLGNEKQATNCLEGYRGLLCHECIYDENQQFQRSGENKCAECLDEGTNIFRITAVGILILAYFTLVIYVSSKSDEASILLRIATNYLQIVSMIASYDLQWPDAVLDFFNPQAIVGTSSQIFSVDCFLAKEYADYETYFLKTALMFSLPFLLMIGYSVFWLILKICKKIAALKITLISTLTTIIFMLHPTLTSYAFSMFSCYTVSGVDVVKDRMDIECWTHDHNKWALPVGILMFVTWIFGLPMVLLFKLNKKKDNLYQDDYNKKYVILLSGLKPQRFFFEYINSIRKVALVLMKIYFVTLSQEVKATLALFFLQLYVIIQERFSPFKEAHFNQIQLRESIASVVTLYGGLLFISQSIQGGLIIGILIIVLVANIYFWGLWIHLLFTTGPVSRSSGNVKRFLYLILRCKPMPQQPAQQLPEQREADETDRTINKSSYMYQRTQSLDVSLDEENETIKQNNPHKHIEEETKEGELPQNDGSRQGNYEDDNVDDDILIKRLSDEQENSSEASSGHQIAQEEEKVSK